MFTDSCDVIVEYNDFQSAMTSSDDGGVTRGCGDVLGNNIIRYNFYNTISAGSVGHMAHYCDNGDCGTQMYSNLLYDAGGFELNGDGRDNNVSYNIWVGEKAGIGVGSMTPAIIENGMDAINSNWGILVLYSRWMTVMDRAANIPGYAEEAEKRRPGITGYSLDVERAAYKDFCLAPVNTFNNNIFINDDSTVDIGLDLNADEYCTVEGNVAYNMDQNPVFVNPTIGDYRIRDGVDYPDIQFEKIGRY